MISKDTIIKVTNRNSGHAGYTIPDLNNLHRHFSPGETKEITMEELRKLSYISGGQTMIQDCLIIHNKDAVMELLNDVEPEYFYTEEDIKNLLLNGSLDQLLDCLDYAPNGAVDLVKSMAVKLKINDIAKRNAIKEKTNFDVSKAIEINEESEKVDDNNKPTARRAAPITTNKETEGAAGRRATAPKYNVVVE